jgi:mono/diheme cytochrome c family protein
MVRMVSPRSWAGDPGHGRHYTIFPLPVPEGIRNRNRASRSEPGVWLPSRTHRTVSAEGRGEMTTWMARSALVVAAIGLTGCGDETPRPGGDAGAVVSSNVDVIPPRWYAPDDVARGGAIYARHCAACHGAGASGAGDWRKRGPDGRFPPPPLDGSAHTWHHPIAALLQQIRHGAPGGSGNMPGFAETLTEEDALHVIAWFQDRWRDEIYAAWHAIEVRSRSRSD